MTIAIDLRLDNLSQMARKRSLVYEVEIAQVAGICKTLEGDVPYEIQDAIITGITGELWPVSRVMFEKSYEAIPPTVLGVSGSYRSIPREVLVRQLDSKSVLPVACGRASLTGYAGDWLVQYFPEQFGIVERSIFEKTYDLVE